MTPIYEKMKELEAFLEPHLSHSESWLLAATTTSPVDPTEEVVARSLRCMASIKLNSARIKVHRYCAFFDIPVFSRKHCDLKSLSPSDNNSVDELRKWPRCSCSTFSNAFPSPASATTPTGSAGVESPSSDGTGASYGQCGSTQAPATLVSLATNKANLKSYPTQPQPQPQTASQPASDFPFSSHQSAKICLRSALNIAQSFDELPFPNPTGSSPQPHGPPVFLSPTSGLVCPRTMPSFACCAMQCAYALLMVHQKTKTIYPYSTEATVLGVGVTGVTPHHQQNGIQRPVAVNNLMARLQQGLTSIYTTLANYATAFEALGGMRGQSLRLSSCRCSHIHADFCRSNTKCN